MAHAKHRVRSLPLVHACLLLSAIASPLDSAAAPCGPPALVRDVDTVLAPSHPRAFLAVGSLTYFVATGPDGLGELWSTNGTQAGTSRLPVPCAFRPIGSVGSVVVVSTTCDGLWRTDGLAAGTRPLFPSTCRDGLYAANLGNELYFGVSGPLCRTDGNTVSAVFGQLPFMPLITLGSRIYMTHWTQARGEELARIDADGATLLPEICPGLCRSVLGRLTASDGRLYFIGNDLGGEGNPEVWSHDPITLENARVTELSPQSSNVWGATDLAALDDAMYFAGDDGRPGGGPQLWRTDGTTVGTSRVSDVYIGARRQGVPGLLVQPSVFRTANDRVFFPGRSMPNGPDSLWVTDGTAAGTRSLGVPLAATPGDTRFEAVDAGGYLAFLATDSTNGRELWRSDGTVAGTRLVKDIFPGALGSNPAALARGGDAVYLDASHPVAESQPWRSDGTASGTVPLLVSAPRTRSGFAGELVTGEAGPLSFSVLRWMPGGGSFGGDLWRSDGTSAGTAPILDGVLPWGRSVRFLHPSPGGIFFGLSEGSGFYLSDGTTTGTAALPLAMESQAHTTADGTSYFRAQTGLGRRLWRTDGTVSGTRIVSDRTFNNPTPLEHAGSRVLFNLGGASGDEVWASDGTDGGTEPLGVRAVATVRLDALAYFKTATGELWRTGGTVATTSAVTLPCLPWFWLQGVAGRSLYVSSNDGLWRFDPVRGECVRLAELGSERVTSFTGAGTTAFFATGETGGEFHLWATDGTPGGTGRIAGPFFTVPHVLTVVGGDLYFLVNEVRAERGPELWFSDGTSANTRRVSDLVGSPVPLACLTTSRLAKLGDSLYFGADDGVTGCELWSLCVGPGRPALLRNTDAMAIDRPPRARELLPLRLTRDRWADGFVSGRVDPAPIVEDASRPLVFYELDAEGPPLRLVKTTTLGVRIEL